MADKRYDAIVVGAGHAGIEAALSCARMGCKTLLISLHLDTIGLMSCNPAVGGIGKGQLVKELDALGGEMARATDACGIQFKTLNASKGAAVWSSRAQVDREKYSLYMQRIVKRRKNLKICQAEVIGLIIKDNVIKGVETKQKEVILAKAIVITPGTFLNGLMHVGRHKFPGGRMEEQDISNMFSNSLHKAGLRLLRFSTCTSARLDGKTINFSRMQVQNGDIPPKPFSLSTKRLKLRQMPCYLAYTNEKTRQIIRNNIDSSALLSGRIEGASVRYCPSFEEKIVKFPGHNRHQIFLEPEGRNTSEYYPNGFFTNMAEAVQEEFIRSVSGLERVKITRFGYGIEHDVVDSTQLYPTLETKRIKNLYLAGQINGTTGYEEAAAQGLIAGINAALRVKEKEPFILDRSTSYIGVLIDDLITKGTPEPYRMFTSRVEYRLLIREDNADLRLRKFGYKLGLVSKRDFRRTQEKQKQIRDGINHLKQTKTVSQLVRRSVPRLPIFQQGGQANSIGESLSSEASYFSLAEVRRRRMYPAGRKLSLFQLLKRPQVKIEDLKIKFPFRVSKDALRGIEIETKYSGFIQRQLAEVRSFKHLEKVKIAPDLDYSIINGLSREIKEKLSRVRPVTLGQANRISGVTPAAIMIMFVYLKRRYQR